MSSAQMYFTNKQSLLQSCSSYGFLYKWYTLVSSTITLKKEKNVRVILRAKKPVCSIR